jgi:hypothetical protein
LHKLSFINDQYKEKFNIFFKVFYINRKVILSNKLIQKFYLNSYQLFAHGNWTNRKNTIGNEEAVTGRSKLLIDVFEKIIKKNLIFYY